MQRNSIVIAFYLPILKAQALYDTVKDRFKVGTQVVEPTDYHVTLAYLPHIDPIRHELLIDIVSVFAQKQLPIHGKLGGIGRFSATENGETNTIYTSLDASFLPDFRQRLVRTLEDNRFLVSKDHGFIPHCTLAYIPKNSSTPTFTVSGMPVQFNKIWLSIYNDRYGFPLDLTMNQLKQGLGNRAFTQMVDL